MKILQVLPYLQTAGTERHVLALSKGLTACGHRVRLLAPPGPLKDQFLHAGIPHIPFPAFRGWPGPTFRGIAAGIEDAKAWGVDLIHVHAGVELLYGVKRALKRSRPRLDGPGVATVFTVHSYFGKRPAVDYRLAAQLSCGWADQVIAVSQTDGALLRRFARGLEGKLTVIHNGMPDSHRSRQEAVLLKRSFLEAYGMGPEAPLCLVVGRLTAQKGIDLLLDALAAYRGEPILLLVAGEGELRGKLEAQANRLGIAAASAHAGRPKVAFLGMRDDVPQLLAAADLMILPSRMEGLSLALVEAHAAGAPCLVTDVGGNAEIVLHGETGLVVPPEDPGAISQALSGILAQPEELRAMGKAARQRYEAHFTVEQMVQKTCAVYQKALTPGSRTRRDTEGT